MRTTLNLDDELMRAIKQRAAATGRTMTEVVEVFLRQGLEAEQAPKRGYRLRWSTVSGHVQPGVDLTDRDALYARMEGQD
ncbi:MAG TPA: ribbon-helix-helix protein, CopG family [Thermoanaerobaculia bacterium]|nr:ribbon-helix-helix protein, CopG family [Thermoanaerobaculia bacterium]